MSYETECSEALSYDTLEEPWYTWANIAKRFALNIEGKEDKEDFIHNAIIRLAEVAEEYRQTGRPMTRRSCNRVAEYTRLRFYRDRKRWGRVFSVSLNSPIPNSDGETEFLDTVPDDRPQDWATWLDAANHYSNSQERVKRAIKRLLNGDKLTGHDQRLITQFRKTWEPEQVRNDTDKLDKVPDLVAQGYGIKRVAKKLRLSYATAQRAVKRAKQGRT